MELTLQDVAVIERIVRQSSYENIPEELRFGSWLSADQDQVMALIEMIPNRLPCGPLSRWWEDLHPCAIIGCPVSVPKDAIVCYGHGADFRAAPIQGDGL